MSYDTYIMTDLGEVDEDGDPVLTAAVDVGNMTSNIGEMFREAMPWRPGMPGKYDGFREEGREKLAGLTGLSGMRCSDAQVILTEGVAWMRANADRCRPHEPDNGWGSYEGALGYLERVLQACQTYPKAILGVNW